MPHEAIMRIYSFSFHRAFTADVLVCSMKIIQLGFLAFSSCLSLVATAGNFSPNKTDSYLKAEAHASPSHDFETIVRNFTTDIEINPETLEIKLAKCRFDFKSLDSNKASRDKKMCNWMEIETYPTAEFSLTSVQAKDADGIQIAKGNLTMHGVTHPIDIRLKTSREGDQITLDGSTQIDYMNWDLPKIRLFIFTVDPELKPSFHLVGTVK